MTLDEQIRFVQSMHAHFEMEAARLEGIAVLQAESHTRAAACAAVVETLTAERDRRASQTADWS